MTKILFWFFVAFSVTTLYAADVAIYDEQTNKVKDRKASVNTLEYNGRTDVVINPAVLAGVPIKYQKVVNGEVVEMSAQEKSDADSTATTAVRNNQISDVDNLRVSAKELANALVGLGIITEQQLKDKIKEQKGLN